MTTKYELSLTQGSIFRFPVLPEQIKVSYGSNNSKLRVYGIGEATIIQDSDAAEISFSSFFPKHYFSGCNYKDIPQPKLAVDEILAMRDSKKAVRLTLSGGIGISMYVTIENFTISEVGGDPGTIQFSIKLKEYREITMRQISVDDSSTRVDNSVASQTYTVVKGDCLWNIAKKYYGSGAKYTVIYNENKAIIGNNPNLIYPGQVLSIPAA